MKRRPTRIALPGARSRRVEIDQRWFCPVRMSGFAMVRVEFSYHRTILRQEDGTWRAEAPAFGFAVTDFSPVRAELLLMEVVRKAAKETLES